MIAFPYNHVLPPYVDQSLTFKNLRRRGIEDLNRFPPDISHECSSRRRSSASAVAQDDLSTRTLPIGAIRQEQRHRNRFR